MTGLHVSQAPLRPPLFEQKGLLVETLKKRTNEHLTQISSFITYQCNVKLWLIVAYL